MKTIAKRLMAMMLIVLMFSISPLCDAAPRSLAAGDGGKYISEVRVGMGETEEEAKKELEAEGFTILKDESGALADLNKDAGSKSALKRGANDKIVYLGYKTTDNVNDAVTDLAVMNMKGGYSIEDYNILMDKQMNTQIKPFVDNFIATLEEYRINYKKSKTSPSHIRADYMRKALNKFTDDDTGGMPMGDLLLNKTKYELGDAAYNALSDAEKKKHCDILTLLMQANGQASLSLKKLVSRAADTSDDTWLERFSATTLDDLIAEIEEEDPSLTSRTDILDALDRKYSDKAETILYKWEECLEQIEDYEYKAEDIADNAEYMKEDIESLSDMDPEEMTDEDYERKTDIKVEVSREAYDTQTVAVCAYLETVEYDGGTLFDFFTRSYDDVSTDEGRRSLYPIVASLSAGQDAGLEFLSIMELFSMALADENSYKQMEAALDEVDAASVYEGVNREIYEKGGVALTSDALRAKALKDDTGKEEYKMGTLPIVFWGVTAGCAIATAVSSIITATVKNTVTHRVVDQVITYTQKEAQELVGTYIRDQSTELSLMKHGWMDMRDGLASGNMSKYQSGLEMWNRADKEMGRLSDRISELNENCTMTKYKDITEKVTNNFTKYLAVGMAVITVIMTTVSTVTTLLDAAAFYDTEFTPIPRYIVEEADITATNKKGEQVMIQNQTAYYKVVKCNRTAGDSSITKKNFEVMGDANDLNGDIGTQWLSLYAVKYVNGLPILADSLLYKLNGGGVPDGYTTGIHDFGAKPACNINSAKYLFPDKTPEIKVYFKRDTSVQRAGAAGSLFTPGSLAIGGGAGLVIGALFGGLVMSRRRKKPEEA